MAPASGFCIFLFLYFDNTDSQAVPQWRFLGEIWGQNFWLIDSELCLGPVQCLVKRFIYLRPIWSFGQSDVAFWVGLPQCDIQDFLLPCPALSPAQACKFIIIILVIIANINIITIIATIIIIIIFDEVPPARARRRSADSITLPSLLRKKS